MKNDRFNESGAVDNTAFDAINAADMEAEVMGRPVVYICSRYSGDVERNLVNARRYSRFAALHGAVPFTPHLLFTQYLDDDLDRERDLAMCMNKRMIKKCNEMWVFGNRPSKGMRREIEWAMCHGMKIRYFTGDCREVEE